MMSLYGEAVDRALDLLTSSFLPESIEEQAELIGLLINQSCAVVLAVRSANRGQNPEECDPDMLSDMASHAMKEMVKWITDFESDLEDQP